MTPTELARGMAALRKTFGGPPKVLRSCPKCGKQMGTKELRQHKPQCRRQENQR